MNCCTPGLPVHYQLPEFTPTHVHRVGGAIQPPHPLSSPSPPVPNPSQHLSLFQWVSSHLNDRTLPLVQASESRESSSPLALSPISSFIGRTDVEAEAPILWPPDVKNWLLRKDPDAGKDWRQEEKGTTEDEMVGWHHRLDGHEFEQALGVGDGQESLACCSPWGHKDSDMTEQLNWSYENKLVNAFLYVSNFVCVCMAL